MLGGRRRTWKGTMDAEELARLWINLYNDVGPGSYGSDRVPKLHAPCVACRRPVRHVQQAGVGRQASDWPNDAAGGARYFPLGMRADEQLHGCEPVRHRDLVQERVATPLTYEDIVATSDQQPAGTEWPAWTVI
jgi:hypothetical protein